MSLSEKERFLLKKDEIRRSLLKYTRKAFRMLPQTDKPMIVDIGFGSGIPTLELTRLSNGTVIGIDINQPALDRLAERIKEAGLTGRIQSVNHSMSDIDVKDESIDIILSEGSIYAVGFERGLREWKRFLKPGGFMIIHDEQGNISEKLEQIKNNSYELLGHFTLSVQTWLDEYFVPLEKLVNEHKTGSTDDPEVLGEIKQAQWELDMFNKDRERNSSVYFVIKKPE